MTLIDTTDRTATAESTVTPDGDLAVDVSADDFEG